MRRSEEEHAATLRGAYARICPSTEADVDAALDSAWDDFEDACVYQCARRLKADAIITRNQKDFARSSIKVFDCDELFAYLEKRRRGSRTTSYRIVTAGSHA